jgi:hypothetical protein
MAATVLASSAALSLGTVALYNAWNSAGDKSRMPPATAAAAAAAVRAAAAAVSASSAGVGLLLLLLLLG